MRMQTPQRGRIQETLAYSQKVSEHNARMHNASTLERSTDPVEIQ